MKLKKSIFVIGMCALLGVSPGVCAEGIAYDKDTYQVVITPDAVDTNANANIALFMHMETTDNTDSLNKEELKLLMPYIYEQKADEAGTVEFDFVFTGDSGNYNIYVSSSKADETGNGVFYKKTVWLDSSEELSEVLSGLNTAIAENTVAAYIADEDNRRMLGVEELYSSASDKTLISSTIENFGAVESYAQLATKLEPITELIEFEKTVKSLDSDTVWTEITPVVDKYFELTGDECTEYTYYSNLSDTSGVDKKVLNHIPFSSLSDFYTDFKASVNAYKDAQTGGSTSSKDSGKVVNTGKSTRSSISISGDITPAVTQPVVTGFADVAQSHWAKSYIDSLVKDGVVNGTGNNTFEPEGTVTREQYIKMLLLAAGTDCSGAECSFSDVSKGQWYYEYVGKAQETELTTGYTDGTFGVGSSITREEMCTLAYRLLKNAGLDTSAAFEADFTDSADISDYAAEAIGFMHGKGIIGGYNDGSFLPKGTATRAEACKIIYMIRSHLMP
ncbi:MAG: S-layer homology domain-containing protein [Clostridia bacterium]|nr:S-layer homology domain-containing protein [Clostridia bacterium]